MHTIRKGMSLSRKGAFTVLLSVILLSGCATPPEYVPADQNHGRLRVFHGTSVYLYLDGKCSKDESKKIHAAAGGYSYFVPNKRIGMPPTADMPLSYHEYSLPAGKQIAITMFWSADSQKNASRRYYCAPSHALLTPKAGHDYDTFMKFLDNEACEIRVRELTMTPSGVATARVLPSESETIDPRCFDDNE